MKKVFFLVVIVSCLLGNARSKSSTKSQSSKGERGSAELAVEAQSIYGDLLQTSQILNRPVSLREFYQQAKAEMPLDLRYEIERVLLLYPQILIPQANLRPLKGKKNEMQLLFVHGSNTLTATLTFKGDVRGSLVFNRYAKSIRRVLSADDLERSNEVLTAVAGKEMTFGAKHGFVALLMPDEVRSGEQQVAYQEHVTKVLSAMERVQSRWIVEARPKSSKHKSWFVESAWAQSETDISFPPPGGPGNTAPSVVPAAAVRAGQPCLSRGGWMGLWNESSVCQAPKEALSSGQSCEVCHPGLYGRGAEKICVNPDPSSTGAATCSTRAKEAGLQFAKGSHPQEAELNLYLNRLREFCTATSLAVPTQKECEDLRFTLNVAIARMKEIETAQSTEATQQAVAATDGDSGPGRDELAPAHPRPPVQARLSPQRVNAGARCERLPTVAPTCSGGQVRALQCSGRGDTVFYYCQCDDRNTERRVGTVYPVACDGGVGFGHFGRPPTVTAVPPAPLQPFGAPGAPMGANLSGLAPYGQMSAGGNQLFNMLMSYVAMSLMMQTQNRLAPPAPYFSSPWFYRTRPGLMPLVRPSFPQGPTSLPVLRPAYLPVAPGPATFGAPVYRQGVMRDGNRKTSPRGP